MTLTQAETQNDSWTPDKKGKKPKPNPNKHFDGIYSCALQSPLKTILPKKKAFAIFWQFCLLAWFGCSSVLEGRHQSLSPQTCSSGLKGRESQIGSQSKMNWEKIMCTFLTMNAINCWDNLPRAMIASPSLEVFKSWLERLSKWCCVAQN